MVQVSTKHLSMLLVLKEIENTRLKIELLCQLAKKKLYFFQQIKAESTVIIFSNLFDSTHTIFSQSKHI